MAPLWYFPFREIDHDGRRLIEPGELVTFERYLRNDDKLVNVGMIRQAPRRLHKWKCLGCGKEFAFERYRVLHQYQGCGRTTKDQIFYALHEEEPDTDNNAYELHLLGRRVA